MKQSTAKDFLTGLKNNPELIGQAGHFSRKDLIKAAKEIKRSSGVPGNTGEDTFAIDPQIVC